MNNNFLVTKKDL